MVKCPTYRRPMRRPFQARPISAGRLIPVRSSEQLRRLRPGSCATDVDGATGGEKPDNCYGFGQSARHNPHPAVMKGTERVNAQRHPGPAPSEESSIAPLRIAAFRRLFVALVIFNLGHLIQVVASSWLILELTASLMPS